MELLYSCWFITVDNEISVRPDVTHASAFYRTKCSHTENNSKSECMQTSEKFVGNNKQMFEIKTKTSKMAREPKYQQLILPAITKKLILHSHVCIHNGLAVIVQNARTKHWTVTQRKISTKNYNNKGWHKPTAISMQHTNMINFTKHNF